MSRLRSTVVNVGGSEGSNEDSIAEEVSLLRRAERAIRSREPELALGFIQELDRRFPHGKLLDERSAARVLANCLELEPDAARRAGEDYLSRTRGHVYDERVRLLCGLDENAQSAKSGAGEKDSKASGD